MIVAAWMPAWSAGQEGLDYGRCHIHQLDDAAFGQMAIQQPESSLLGIETPVQSSLGGEELANRLGQWTCQLDARRAHGSPWQHLPVAESDIPKALDRDLGVDLGRGGRPMSDVVADGLQRKAGIDKTLNTGVAQRVRAGTPDRHTGLVQVMARPSRDRRVRQRLLWRKVPQEQLPIRRMRATALQVVDDGIADQW